MLSIFSSLDVVPLYRNKTSGIRIGRNEIFPLPLFRVSSLLLQLFYIKLLKPFGIEGPRTCPHVSHSTE